MLLFFKVATERKPTSRVQTQAEAAWVNFVIFFFQSIYPKEGNNATKTQVAFGSERE